MVALIEESTVGAAAKRVGISESTLGRWQKNPGFQQALSDARSALASEALGSLGEAGRQAVSALVRNLNCGTPGVEVKAASETLKWMIEAMGALELKRRVEALEAEGDWLAR